MTDAYAYWTLLFSHLSLTGFCISIWLELKKLKKDMREK